MEILAPCGGPDHIKAAVYAGADAVYLGGSGFSARRAAVNFSTDEIREAARFCRGFGVKLYVAVNILTRDGEWDDLRSYITELADAAPDALIVQDLGVACLCRSILPEMPLHASTQLSVHTPEGVRFCARAGFSRVVAGRECGRHTLSQMVQVPGVGIEVFIHGALCVSVSGQCGLSAVIGGRSGNRGLCAQPCRLDFRGGPNRFALSLKDLSLVREAPLLKSMGVQAVKIEGRMKRPEYVAAAVRACRASLDGEDFSLDDLRAVFSRGGFTQGYFYNRHTDMGGVRSTEDAAASAAVLPRLAGLSRAPSRRVPVSAEFDAGTECVLRVSDGSDEATVGGPMPQKAVTRETTPDEAERLLSRMGATPFVAENIRVRIKPGLSIPASQINAMRREACGLLLERRIERLTPRYTINSVSARREVKAQPSGNPPPLRVHCATVEQARAVYDDADQLVLDIESIGSAPDLPHCKLIADPGRFAADERLLERKLAALPDMGVRSLLCQNPAHAVLGRSLGLNLHGGLGLNVFNSEAAAFWADYGMCGVTASMELRLSEGLALNGGIPAGLAVYGRLPVMLLRRCPLGRVCENGLPCPVFLSDRTGRRFPLRCHGDYMDMLNADTLWMADRLSELRGAAFLSILLHDESPLRAQEILKAYRTGGAPPAGHTRGLFTRGVE